MLHSCMPSARGSRACCRRNTRTALPSGLLGRAGERCQGAEAQAASIHKQASADPSALHAWFALQFCAALLAWRMIRHW